MIGQRFIFHQRTQKPGEPITQFLMELRRLARTCEFGQFLEEALRDRLVYGLNNSSIQKKLLNEKDLTLQRTVDIAMAAEMAVLQSTEQLTPHNEPEVMAVQQVCKCCGKQGHSQGVCQLQMRVCFRCGKKGHLQTMCQGQSAKHHCSQDNKLPSVKHVEEVQADVNSSEDDFALWTISGDHKEGYHVNLQINGKHIHMELDKGAAVSVISEQQWNQLFPIRLLESYTGSPLRGYSGQQLQVKGQKEVKVLYAGQSLKLPVVVIAGHERAALLGRDWLSHLKLDWTQLHRLQADSLEQMLAKYSQVFERGIGTIVGY